MVAVAPLLFSAMEVISFQRGDDDSFSSTIRVEPADHGKQQPQQTVTAAVQAAKRRRRRAHRVRFNDDANTVHGDEMPWLDDMQVDDEAPIAASTTWYTAMEYQQLRQSAISSAHQIIAIETRNRAPRSYMKVMERCYQRCLNFQLEQYEAQDRLHLIRWVQAATSRVGLEKWSVKTISAERARRRSGVLSAILFCDDNEDARRLASLRWSQPSAVFARVWADAVAMAVRQEQQESMQA